MSVSMLEMVSLCMMMSLIRLSSDCHLVLAVRVRKTLPILTGEFLRGGGKAAFSDILNDVKQKKQKPLT